MSASSSEARVARCVRPEVRALQAYAVPPVAPAIKLDAMENPYPWPAGLQAQWLEVLRGVAINRYPNPRAPALVTQLRATYALPPQADVLLGNGSDELLQVILLALAQPGTAVLAPVPTFVMYELLARALGMRFVGVPLAADFALDTEAMLAAIERERPAVIFLAYPNNPTGNLFDAQAIAAIIDAAPGVVVIDEAYHAFAQATLLPALAQHEHVFVLRTLSKLGLAGLRLGFLCGAPAWLAEFDKVRLPYNVNVLTQATVQFALTHAEAWHAQAARIARDRAALAQALAALPGVQVWPSAANFILFRTARAADAVFASLVAEGVLIKNLTRAHPQLKDCLRVTVGTPAENATFLAALRAALTE